VDKSFLPTYFLIVTSCPDNDFGQLHLNKIEMYMSLTFALGY
jgi:hypothetical protein